jgi:tetratricopeptide (TPR) repeat protein
METPDEKTVLSRRTVALLSLLLLVAGGAIWLRTISRSSDASSAPPIVRAEELEPRDTVQPVPSRHPRIEDNARILAPFEARLGRMADAFYDDLGIDVHVVTATDAEATIESQADRVFQQRKIGIGAPTGGLLIILNPAVASARIEVGYTLEGGLTDLHMGRIARDQLAPYTSYAVAGMAVMDVLHYLRDQVYLSAALGNLTLAENFQNSPGYFEYRRFVSGGAGAKAALGTKSMDADLKRIVPKDERALYAPSPNVQESVEAFLRATANLAGDPTLELFTEGSRVMRAHYPLARFEELQRVTRIESSLPLVYLQDGDYAVATSRRPAQGFVPVLLHREEGLWRVDLVETWKNLFFNSDGNYFLRNSNTPYAFGLSQFGAGRYYDIAPIPLKGSIGAALAELDGKDDALSKLWSGDIWLRNGFVFPQAYSAFEAARRAAPEDPLVLQILAQRALYLGFPELAIPAFEKIGPGAELWLAEAYNDLNDIPAAQRWISHAIKENPYNLQALRWQKFLAEKGKQTALARQTDETIAMLDADSQRRTNSVVLFFNPQIPQLEPDTTIDVNGTQVFDHSHFGVTMKNTSNRPVEIDSVTLTSMGTAAASGLGDIKGYWKTPAGQGRLLAGESVSFSKVWGFVVDTGHLHVRYVFRTCWHGVGTAVHQCATQWVDAMPRPPASTLAAATDRHSVQ